MSTMYIVATPIGNLEDMTLRALRVLKDVDLIACEDTRHTKILLNRYEITTPTVSYHQHSRLTKIDWLVEQLVAGKNIALVSDAGTPGINDPGGMLIAAAITANSKRTTDYGSTQKSVSRQPDDLIQIIPVPGANAGVTLLSASGWPADQYLFLGYLPKKKGRKTLLDSLKAISYQLKAPIVFYESPHRLIKTLEDLGKVLEPQTTEMLVGRELTKQFEEIWRGSLAEAQEYWSKQTIRGEFAVAFRQKK